MVLSSPIGIDEQWPKDNRPEIMKIDLFVALFLLISVILSAQPGISESQSAKESGKEQYTLSGFRHGVSFFPCCEISSLFSIISSDTLDFIKYHSLDVIYYWLRNGKKNIPV